MNLTAPCRFLDWDSSFFAVRVARVNGARLTPDLLAEIMAWCRRESIDFLYFLADASDNETVVLAERAGFHFVDMRVTLERRMTGSDDFQVPSDSKTIVRLSQPSDLNDLLSIAAVSHTDGRWYYDTRLTDAQASSLYVEWVRRSCEEGFADAVLVATHEGRVAGYLTVHLEPPSGARIGMFGVHAALHGRGIATELLRGTLARLREQGVDSVRVVTQGRNTAAQRIYQRSGFVTRSVEIWHHKWFT